jgi:benzoate-CoA ligase family protein
MSSKLNIASYFIDRTSETNSSRVAILGQPQPVSYETLRELTNRTGRALRALGCKPKDRVLIALPDSSEFVAAFFGAAKIGALPVPINVLAKTAEIQSYLAQAGAAFAVVHSSALAEFIPAVNPDEIRTMVLGEGAYPWSWCSWKQSVFQADPELDAYPADPDEEAFLLFSSGSTGQQKLVVHSHKSMIAASQNVGRGAFGIGPYDRTLSVPKLFFAYGLCSGMYFPLSVGATTVLNSQPIQLNQVADLIALHRPTILFGVPTFYSALLEAHRSWLELDLSSVRFVVSGGEHTPREIVHQFKDRFSLEVLDGIGSTEMLTQFITNRPGKARLDSCGIEVPNCEVRLVGDEGYEVPDGNVGTLMVRSDTAFIGYWNRPEQTAKTKVDGWVITGDRLSRDADGYLHYFGRSDEMMKVSGMWASFSEVESILLECPSITQCVVMSKEDRPGQKRLVAYIVAREQIANTDISRHLGRSLPQHMLPSAYVTLSEFPLTSAGKIDRQALLNSFPEADAPPRGPLHRTLTQELLSAVLEQSLHLNHVSPDFILELDRTLAGQIAVRISEVFQIELTAEVLEALRTSEELAAWLASTLNQNGTVIGTPSIRDSVRTILTEMIGYAPADTERLMSSGLIDSLSTVRLIARLEEVLPLRIPDDELFPSSFESVTAITNAVRSHAQLIGSRSVEATSRALAVTSRA